MDKHNQARQYELGLEKNWITHNCYMRLVTTLIGLAVTDTWYLMNHEKMLPLRVHQEEDRLISIKSFAGIVSAQLLKMSDELEAKRKREIVALYPLIVFWPTLL